MGGHYKTWNLNALNLKCRNSIFKTTRSLPGRGLTSLPWTFLSYTIRQKNNNFMQIFTAVLLILWIHQYSSLNWIIGPFWSSVKMIPPPQRRQNSSTLPYRANIDHYTRHRLDRRSLHPQAFDDFYFFGRNLSLELVWHAFHISGQHMCTSYFWRLNINKNTEKAIFLTLLKETINTVCLIRFVSARLCRWRYEQCLYCVYGTIPGWLVLQHWNLTYYSLPVKYRISE